MTPEFIEAVLGGNRADAEARIGARLADGWPEGRRDRGVLEYRLAQIRRDPTALRWLLRGIVLREPAAVLVGHFNFHGPPDEDGMVEVGYSIAPEHRRRGCAEEAVRTMLAWAFDENRVRRVRASVGPSNAASLGLVAKLGFVRTGTQWDEIDGEEIVFELVRPG